MVRARTILAIILVAIGLVWIGQGTGLLKSSSVMVGDGRWALIGVACVLAGLALGWAQIRAHRA